MKSNLIPKMLFFVFVFFKDMEQCNTNIQIKSHNFSYNQTLRMEKYFMKKLSQYFPITT